MSHLATQLQRGWPMLGGDRFEHEVPGTEGTLGCVFFQNAVLSTPRKDELCLLIPLPPCFMRREKKAFGALLQTDLCRKALLIASKLIYYIGVEGGRTKSGISKLLTDQSARCSLSQRMTPKSTVDRKLFLNFS